MGLAAGVHLVEGLKCLIFLVTHLKVFTLM